MTIVVLCVIGYVLLHIALGRGKELKDRLVDLILGIALILVIVVYLTYGAGK